MALLFIDGFDHYVTADITEKWAAIFGTVAIGAYGRNSSNGVRITSGVNTASGAGLFVGHASMASGVAGWAMQVATLPGTALEIAGTYEGGGDAVQWNLYLNTDGSMSVCRGGSIGYPASKGTLLGTTPGGVIQAGVWAYVECSWTISDAAGAVTIRVDGIEVLALTSVDTKQTATAASTSWYFGAVRTGAFSVNFDDFYLCNTTSPNNTFLGDVKVDTLFPTGAGTTTQWDPDSGSNYARVQETTPDGDTSYVSTAVLNEIDTYAFGNITSGATVKGLQVLANVKKMDAGTCKLAPVCRPVSTDRVGSDYGVNIDYAYHMRQCYDVSPETSSAWTESEVNGSEFGFKKTA